jgi:hypothetical protein
MIAAVRVLAAVVGVGLLGLVVDAAVAAAGGYGMPAARLMVGLAAGIAAGSLAVGVAWDHGRRRIALCLVAALMAGEAWTLLQTAERTIAHRDRQQAPLRAHAETHAKAVERVMAAESALAGTKDTPPLARAQVAKASADAAVVAKSAEKGCAANCRQLLQAQVDAAAAEVAAARTELAIMRAGADSRLQQARADLAALPLPPSVSPLADRLGIQGWSLDIVHAVLASLAANGLGAFLLAFSAHGWHRRKTEAGAATAIEVERIAATGGRDAAAEADHFARTTLRPNKAGRVKIAEIRTAYHDWCRGRGIAPLPDRDIGEALNELFSSVGLSRRGRGKAAAIVGVEFRQTQPLQIEGPQNLQ